MKKFTEILSIILALVMVTMCFPVYANDSDITMTVSADNTDVKAGDTVTVSVALSENSDLNYFTLDLVYDNSVLEYSSHTVYGDAVSNEKYTENKVRTVFANNDAITSAVTVLTVSFNVLSSECSSVSLDIIDAGNYELNELSVTANSLSVHSYGEWSVVTEPSCEGVGQKSRSCSCGDVAYATVDALGHDYADEYTVDVAPDCTNEGSESQHCSRCDSKQNVTAISPTGHSLNETVKEPTCLEDGLRTITCENCDYISTEAISATGHSYNMEITRIPTHTENGEETYTCAYCGDVYTSVIEADGTHKHIPSVTTEPTCTQTGVMTYICACGDTYTETITALGHSHGETVEENHIAPTCVENGSYDSVVYCVTCGEELSRVNNTVAATGHTEATLSATAPTCTQSGLTAGIECSVCGEVLTAQQEITATGHTPDSEGECDTCGEKICDHNCHKGGIAGFFWKISNFFNKLFGSKKYCECGYAHY